MTERPKPTSSDLRTFGLIVATGFTILGGFSYYRHRLELEQPFAETCWMVAGVLVVMAVIAPPILRPFFVVWTAIGHVLGWVNMRIILGLAFFGLVTPIGWVARLVRKEDPCACGVAVRATGSAERVNRRSSIERCTKIGGWWVVGGGW